MNDYDEDKSCEELAYDERQAELNTYYGTPSTSEEIY